MTCWLALTLLAATPQSAGPRTTAIDLHRYRAVHYVSASTGSDAKGDGSERKPWASVGHALARITHPAAVLVAAGVYKEPTLQMKPDVDLYGGYDPKSWSRDIFRHVSTLDGEGAHRILTGADHARID